MADDTKQVLDAKTLEKMTVKDLRTLALETGSIVGVHSMKKTELLAAIKKVKGIVDDVTPKGIRAEINRRLKARIRELRAQKEEARKANDKKQVRVLQKKINRLKKRTRKAA